MYQPNKTEGDWKASQIGVLVVGAFGISPNAGPPWAKLTKNFGPYLVMIEQKNFVVF